jgi:ethanolamine utilization protein EutA
LSIHFPDHHGEEPEEQEKGPSIAWSLDNVELTTVGIDIGSSTSHLLFARLHMQRMSQSLSSRFAVVHREVLHRSPIMLTPFAYDDLISAGALREFFDAAYADAGLTPEDVDTGAVILTGVALESSNSRAIADLFADAGGRFVCASAGHNLEAILAAHGSGAVAFSREVDGPILHLDIGGGTTKLALIESGAVVATAAVAVGGRQLALHPDGRLWKVDPAARSLARELGLALPMMEVAALDELEQLTAALADVIVEAAGGEVRSKLGRELLLTSPLDSPTRPRLWTCSGGVAEYVFGRETEQFGDIAPMLATSFRAACAREGVELRELGEGIRATVIGASEFTVQVSGNTVHVTNPDVLPLHNLPVVRPRLPAELEEASVAAAIRQALDRLDLDGGDTRVALALPWQGEPHYGALRALAGGVVGALSSTMVAGHPLVIACVGDVGRSLGGILEEELGVAADLVCIDGLELLELDYIDVGKIIHPAGVVPVVIKSLAFPYA